VVLRSLLFVESAVFLGIGSLTYFAPALLRIIGDLSFSAQLKMVCFFLFVVVGLMWIGVAFYCSSTETYARGFKAKIIEKIIQFIDKNNTLAYTPQGETQSTKIALYHSRLFQNLKQTFSINQDDCVAGRIGKTEFFFSEILAENEIEHRWANAFNLLRLWREERSSFTFIALSLILAIGILKGFPYIIGRILKGQRINYEHFSQEVVGNEVTRNLIFKGLFFRAEFNKKFRGKTTILPNNLSSKIQPFHRSRGQIARLEDPEFSKYFTVYSNNQVEARYVLSTSLMERLVRFRKKANRQVYISFVESMIYIAIPYQEDLFEPKLFSTMLNFNPIRDYFENLQLMIGIVEDLNLNRRIWG
jgi:Protein of unknown function (DUF3137)